MAPPPQGCKLGGIGPETYLAALDSGPRCGGCAECKLSPSAFCMSMLMHGVSLEETQAPMPALTPVLMRLSAAS